VTRGIARQRHAGVAAVEEMIAADPYAFRPEWVNPKTFWDDLERMLGRESNGRPLGCYKALLDRAALAADAALTPAAVTTKWASMSALLEPRAALGRRKWHFR